MYVIEQKIDKVKTLLENKSKRNAQLNALDSDGHSPLALAQNRDIIRMLLTCGADPMWYDEEHGTTILMEAVQEENVDKVSLLLSHEKVIETIDVVDGFDSSAVSYAVDSRNVEILKMLLVKGAAPFYIKADGYTLLMKAAKDNDVFLARFLLYDSDVGKHVLRSIDYVVNAYSAASHALQNLRDCENLACDTNTISREIVGSLLRRGCGPFYNPETGSTILMRAIIIEDIELLKLALGSNNPHVLETIDHKDIHQQSALCYAFPDQPEAMELLLEYGASAWLPRYNDRNMTLLFASVQSGDVDLVRRMLRYPQVRHSSRAPVLVEEGSDANYVDCSAWAANHGMEEMVTVLEEGQLLGSWLDFVSHADDQDQKSAAYINHNVIEFLEKAQDHRELQWVGAAIPLCQNVLGRYLQPFFSTPDPLSISVDDFPQDYYPQYHSTLPVFAVIDSAAFNIVWDRTKNPKPFKNSKDFPIVTHEAAHIGSVISKFLKAPKIGDQVSTSFGLYGVVAQMPQETKPFYIININLGEVDLVGDEDEWLCSVRLSDPKEYQRFDQVKLD